MRYSEMTTEELNAKYDALTIQLVRCKIVSIAKHIVEECKLICAEINKRINNKN